MLTTGTPTASDLYALSGSEIETGELAKLNESLRARTRALYKADYTTAGPGQIQQGVEFSGEFTPLVPQSIQNEIDMATFRQEDIRFWRRLTQVPVTSTLHESVVLREHGSMDLDPFIAEGGVAVRSKANFDRKVVKVRFIAEMREVSDVATMVSTVGSMVKKAALALETKHGTTALLGKLERALFWADNSVSDLHFDGLYRQVRDGAPDNYLDKEGDPITPQELVEAIWRLYAAPNHGRATAIYMEPMTVAALQQIATAYGRYQMTRGLPEGAENLTFSNGQLGIAGVSGVIPILPTPLLNQVQKPNTAALGENAPDKPALATSIGTGADGGSRFRANDAGDYVYQIVAIGDKGMSEPLATSTVSVAKGDKVSITISDSGKPDGSKAKGVRYYRVFRTTKNETDASEATYMWQFPRAAAGSDTVIEDLNHHRPNTAPVFVLRDTADCMKWVKLLDFMRRPLAQVQTTVPFMLMQFGALHVTVPTKQFVIDNVKLGLGL